MVMDFYYMPASAPCRSVLLAAKHFGIELNLKLVNLLTGDQMKPEFVALNPQHNVPFLNDNGFFLSESRPIIQYFANAYGNEGEASSDTSIYPTNPKKRFIVDQRLAFDMGSLYFAFSEAYYPVIFGGQSKIDGEKLKKFNEVLSFLENILKKTAYVAADHLTIADFTVAASLATMEGCGHDFTPYPAVSNYLNRLKKELVGYAELNQKGAQEFGGWFKANLKA